MNASAISNSLAPARNARSAAHVTARAEHIRLAQAGDFIRRLRRAPVVELGDEMFGIDRRRSPAEQLRERALR